VAESLSDNPDEYTDKAQLNSLHRRGIELVRCQFEERTWQLFWLTVVEERPTSEVAVEFDISANAVRQARSRVLRRLRQELGDVPPQ
jgi:RNA polymerase sigma-70 factor (ECF subfamily)